MYYLNKYYLFIFFALLLSCSSNEESLPTAGFLLSNETPTQWDKVSIIDKSNNLGDISYEVIGGEYSLSDDLKTIVFFESGIYTVNQIITNSNGSDTFTINVSVSSANNKYYLDGEEYTINKNAFWYDATQTGGTVYIRILTEVKGSENPNLIKIIPIMGNNSIEATYVWGNNGAIGTYDAGIIFNWGGGYDYDWISKGESGQNLTIELFYEDFHDSKNNAYIITLPSYKLNYGYWNFLQNRFIKEGEKNFSLYYKGRIDPVKK